MYNERIVTSNTGVVQVLLLDDSTFTVGPGSSFVIDKFVYDPARGTGGTRGARCASSAKLSKSSAPR